MKNFFFIVILLFGLVLLVGCQVKSRVITETVVVHDTLVTHHSDTIRDVRVVSHTDTIRQVEWHTVTLGQTGDTIREVHIYHDREKTIVVDSTDRYRAVVDSLKAALDRETSKYKEVVKTKHVVRWWEWCLIVGIVMLLVYGVKKMK